MQTIDDDFQDATQAPRQDSYDERSSTSQLWYALRLCLGYLTRIPVFAVEYSGHSSIANASWAFPIIGIVVALAGALVLWLSDAFNLGGQLSALLALAIITALTGALHETGLAKTADGLGLRGDRDAHLTALHNPQLGVFGIIALIVAYGARWTALGDLISISLSHGVTGLIAAAAISRGILPGVMHAVPSAGTEEGSFAARPGARPAGIALAISAVIAFFAFGFGGAILVAIVAGLVAFALTLVAKRQIGGQNDAVLGAIQQATEVAILITASGLAT
jgi:adenosylcobinamide-GDP ribazoletransferase